MDATDVHRVPRVITAGSTTPSTSPRCPPRSSQTPSFTRHVPPPERLPQENVKLAFHSANEVMAHRARPLPAAW